ALCAGSHDGRRAHRPGTDRGGRRGRPGSAGARPLDRVAGPVGDPRPRRRARARVLRRRAGGDAGPLRALHHRRARHALVGSPPRGAAHRRQGARQRLPAPRGTALHLRAIRPEGGSEMAQLTKAQLLQAYRTMRTIREFEDRIHTEFATGEIPGFVHLYAGEEASATGVCMHLAPDDRIASTHRGHGHCIAKGVDVMAMMAELYGKATGACGGKGGSMHIADLNLGMMGANGIVGGGPPLICGAALAAKHNGRGGVAVAFFGDGASNQGTTLEALNLATVWNLPAVFVAENNGYA